MANLLHTDDSGRGKVTHFMLRFKLYYGCQKRPRQGRRLGQGAVLRSVSGRFPPCPLLAMPAGSSEQRPAPREPSLISPASKSRAVSLTAGSGQGRGRGWMGFRSPSPRWQPVISQAGTAVISPPSARSGNEATQGAAAFLRLGSCSAAKVGWKRLLCLLQHRPSLVSSPSCLSTS